MCHILNSLFSLNMHTIHDFLVVQWLRICLAMQGTQVPSLVWELRSHMLRHHNY